MNYVIGALAGLAWGALWAMLNHRINKAALVKANTRAILIANVLRLLVDFAALGAIFLLRKVLPFRYETALLGTAMSLSLLNIFLAYRLSRPGTKPAAEESGEEERE